jgi:hypothetical protein
MVRAQSPSTSAQCSGAREQPEATANGGESSHGESGGGESGGGAPGLAMLFALCTSTKAATCRRDAKEDGALGRRKDFDASTRVTYACTEAVALPTSQMKHCMQMM